MSIGQWIVRNSQWFPDKLALVAGERRFTYAEFNARVNRQVNGLIAGGMQRGDRIAYLGNNTAEAVECTAAVRPARSSLLWKRWRERRGSFKNWPRA